MASNASTSPNLVALSGTSVPLGTLTGSATAFNYGNQVVGTSSATQTFTLSNTGPGDLTVSALDVTGNAANSDDFTPGPGTTCNVDNEPFVPFSLASGGSCDIVVAFTPTALGLRQIVVTFTATNSTVSSVVVTLTGTGTGGDITFTNGGGDNLWTTPANWNLNRIPNLADTAHINGVAPNSANVTLNSARTRLPRLDHTSAGTLTITGAGVSLTVSSPSTATNITVNTTGHLTANNTLNIGIVNLGTNGLLDGDGNVTILSQLNWTGGGGMGGTGDITNNGVASINGGVIGGKTFINNGTANVTNLTMGDGAIFNNLATRTVTAEGPAGSPRDRAPRRLSTIRGLCYGMELSGTLRLAGFSSTTPARSTSTPARCNSPTLSRRLHRCPSRRLRERPWCKPGPASPRRPRSRLRAAFWAA